LHNFSGAPVSKRIHNSAVDGGLIPVNRLGDDQRGNRRRSGTDRYVARVEERKSVQDSGLHECSTRDETFGANVPNFRTKELSRKFRNWKSIALKIKELAETGSLKYFEELSTEFPTGILELFSLPGLGAKKSRRFTTNSASVQSSSCRRRANRAGCRIARVWRNNATKDS
jgi:hypothetical protein